VSPSSKPLPLREDVAERFCILPLCPRPKPENWQWDTFLEKLVEGIKASKGETSGAPGASSHHRISPGHSGAVGLRRSEMGFKVCEMKTHNAATAPNHTTLV
jgi:hypothetical protein